MQDTFEMLEELLEQEQFELLFPKENGAQLNGNVMRHMKVMRENRAKKTALPEWEKRKFQVISALFI